MPSTFRRSDIPKLDLDVDRGSNFKAWLEEWSAYIAVSGLSEENGDTKYHVLRLAFSRETASVVNNLGLPEEDKKKIDKIIQALKVHVEGAVNETVERRNFRKRRQHTQESFDDFLVSLRDLIKTCSYCAADDCVNRALRDQIIEGLQDGDTIEELLRQKDLTLDKSPNVQSTRICKASARSDQRQQPHYQRHIHIQGETAGASWSSKPETDPRDQARYPHMHQAPTKIPRNVLLLISFVINATSLDILHRNVAQNRLELMSCNNRRMMNLNRDNCFQSCV